MLKSRYCKRGHFRSPENLYQRGTCKKCHAFTSSVRKKTEKYKRYERNYRIAHHDTLRVRKFRLANPEHAVWVSMRQRCENPNNNRFTHYGAIGVRVCQRWHKFEHFLADLGPRPSKNHSLSRLADSGNYEPGRVIWGDRAEQALQRKIKRLLNLQPDLHPSGPTQKQHKFSYKSLKDMTQ